MNPYLYRLASSCPTSQKVSGSEFVEGLNNKIKTLKRRCYGIPRITTLFQRLYLDLQGYWLFSLYTH